MMNTRCCTNCTAKQSHTWQMETGEAFCDECLRHAVYNAANVYFPDHGQDEIIAWFEGCAA